MLSRLNATQKGILLALAGSSTFVAADTSAKWLSIHYSVMQIVPLIYGFCLLCCLIGAPVMGGLKNTLKTQKLKIHIARGLANTILSVSVVYAFQNLPLTTVYPILFLSPFLMTVAARSFFKEAVSKMDWLIIATGFCGILIAYRPGFETLSPWLLAAFTCTVFMTVLSLLARPLGDKETVMSLAFYPSLITFTLLCPFMFTETIEAAHLLVFAFTGIMVCAGITCFAAAYRMARYAAVSPVQYSELILGFFSAYIVFGELPSIWMIAGSIVIAASGIMLAMTHKHREQLQPTTV